MNFDKQKLSHFVVDTVVAGVTKKVFEKILYKIDPKMEDREIASNLIAGGASLIVTNALETRTHHAADLAVAKLEAAVKAAKKTKKTTTD